MKFSDENGDLKFVVFLVKRPCLSILITMGTAILFSIIAIANTYGKGADLIATPGSDADLSHITSINSDAYSLSVDFVNGGAEVEEVESNKTELQQTQSSGVLLMLFESEGDNIFTTSMLEQAIAVQRKLTTHPEFGNYCQWEKDLAENTTIAAIDKCKLPLSPLNIFYASTWDQEAVTKAINAVKAVDSYSSKATQILNCLTLLPSEYQSQVTIASFSIYSSGALPAIPGLPSEDEILTTVKGICPFLTIETLDEVGNVLGSALTLSQMSATFDGKGTTLNDPTKVLELCATMLEVPILKPLVDFFFERNFTTTNLKSKYTRILINYGMPYDGFRNKEDQEDEQKDRFKAWFQGEFRDYLQTDGVGEGFKAYYFSTNLIFDEILSIMIGDAMKALGSMAFVYGYLAFQTGSFFLASAGMAEIVMSLPLAYVFYSLIFQFAYLGTFCVMCIYIVLAIGADDIFVFMDAYKQSAFEGTEVLKSLEARMSWVYRRAASAMLITSFTTMAAFFATAVSPLTTVRSFGIYAAFVILSDFILVITFFPACVVLYHNNMELKGCCAKCGCCSKQSETTTERYRKGAESPPVRKTEQFLAETFGPFVTKSKFVIVALFVVWLVVNVILAMDIEAAQAADQILPSEHPFQKIVTIQSDYFGSSSQDQFNVVNLVWGVDGVNRDGVDFLYDPVFLGQVNWDTTFTLDEAAQQHILSVCEDLVNQEDIVAKDKDDPLKASYTCVIEDFRKWAIEDGVGFPVATAGVASALQRFLQESTIVDSRASTFAEKHRNSVGIVDGEVKYVAVKIESTLSKHMQYSKSFLEEEYSKYEAYVVEKNTGAPASANNMYQTDETRFWVRMRSQEIYVSSAITGAITGTCLAFVVILFATRCVRVAVFASLTIAGILLSVLAFMVALGWQLGTIESINITILAGFSVDYVVHLAHAYTASLATTRAERVHQAIAEMGISVFSGMVTSVGASLLLFTCQLQFFAKFGGFLCTTIAFSWLWANLFFMSMLAIMGPEGDKKSKVLYL